MQGMKMSEKQQGNRHERIHTGFSYYDGHQIRDQDLLDRGDRICRSPRDSDGPDRSRADHGPSRRGDHVKEVSGYAAARRPLRSHGVHGSGPAGDQDNVLRCGYRYRNAGIQPCDAEYTLKFRRRNADPALKTV